MFQVMGSCLRGRGARTAGCQQGGGLTPWIGSKCRLALTPEVAPPNKSDRVTASALPLNFPRSPWRRAMLCAWRERVAGLRVWLPRMNGPEGLGR